MLIFSSAKVTVDKQGNVRVEGTLRRHHVRITEFVKNQGLNKVTVRIRGKRLIISGNVDIAAQQRLRNFIVNECRLGTSL